MRWGDLPQLPAGSWKFRPRARAGQGWLLLLLLGPYAVLACLISSESVLLPPAQPSNWFRTHHGALLGFCGSLYKPDLSPQSSRPPTLLPRGPCTLVHRCLCQPRNQGTAAWCSQVSFEVKAKVREGFLSLKGGPSVDLTVTMSGCFRKKVLFLLYIVANWMV